MTDAQSVEAVVLLPCPFCGGAAVRKPDPGKLNEMFGLIVEHADGCFLGLVVYASDEAVDAAWSCRAATPTDQDTVVFVQEWMMSGDHEADQWHRDFASAIDARSCPAPTDQRRLVGELVEALSKGGALTDEPAPTPSFPQARKVVIAFEDPDHSYEAMLAIGIAVRATRAKNGGEV